MEDIPAFVSASSWSRTGDGALLFLLFFAQRRYREANAPPDSLTNPASLLVENEKADP
jgi:hypothetical protein